MSAMPDLNEQVSNLNSLVSKEVKVPQTLLADLDMPNCWAVSTVNRLGRQHSNQHPTSFATGVTNCSSNGRHILEYILACDQQSQKPS